VRLIVNSLVFLMILGLLAGVVLSTRRTWTASRTREATYAEVLRFQRQIAVHSQLGAAALNERGYPKSVEPTWFNGHLPENILLPPEHPWLEIADKEHADRLHPVNWATDDIRVARFWYNPEQGVVRARVPREASEPAAADLYNDVNGTDLAPPSMGR
jgi:hypothetical protein